MGVPDRFVPPHYLRHPMVQTVLASSRLRGLGANPMAACAREEIIDAGGGVRLQGFHSEHGRKPSPGLVIMLHGWEGGAHSSYILDTGRYLYRLGFDVHRLNLRDHGTSHHLNRGLFMGTLIDESFAAVKAVAARAGGGPVFLLAFSMGGNFALRMARLWADEKPANIRRVACINPPLDPLKTTLAIDRMGLMRRYFLKKWKRSMALKQRLFPETHDFTGVLPMDSCMAITRVLVRRYTDYASAEDYFSRYTLTGDSLRRVGLPVTIIHAEDDPLIPVEDLRRASLDEKIELVIQPYGGHCGYVQNLALRCWYLPVLARLFGVEGAARPAG